MPILIDGYNLLHVTGIVGQGRAAGTLESSRLALLDFLADSLDPQEIPQTTVVFDAHGAPAGLPRLAQHRGITIRYAAEYASADELLQELIDEEPAPRRLVVVSGDRQVQRAARRRRAKAVDSDRWFADLIRRRREREAAQTPSRPAVPLLEEDVNYWLRQFGGESELAKLLNHETPRPAKSAKKKKNQPDPLEPPFPPGYGDDLLGEL